MLTKINNFFGARYTTYKASKLCKYKFSILLLFLFSFLSKYFFKYTNIITSTWIFCNRVILIDILVDGMILASFYILGDRSYEIGKLAIIILNYII